MSQATDLADFRERLRRTFADFERDEPVHREEYARSAADASDREILERVTRRFLLDPLLRSLDWNPDDPRAVSEEARAQSLKKDRLYLDYLGLSQDMEPTLVFEAKAYDLALPHEPYRSGRDPLDMPAVLAEAIGRLNRGKASGLTVEWEGYINDLKIYVDALAAAGKTQLRRVVISSGHWLIVFSDPLKQFASQSPAIALIDCFGSPQDMADRSEKLFSLLHRRQLVNTLPVLMDFSEAVRFLPPGEIDGTSRGVVQFTELVGAERARFSARWFRPAILLRMREKWFAIIDSSRPAIQDGFGLSLQAQLAKAGGALETRVLRWVGETKPKLGLAAFDGFGERAAVSPATAVAPMVGSTNAIRGDKAKGITYVQHIGEPAEYVIATGDAWHYKSDVRVYCIFHDSRHAELHGYPSANPSTRTKSSFTIDTDNDHCSQGDHKAARQHRCHIVALEGHMCCQVCVFVNACWPADKKTDPCPSLLSPNDTP